MRIVARCSIVLGLLVLAASCGKAGKEPAAEPAAADPATGPGPAGAAPAESCASRADAIGAKLARHASPPAMLTTLVDELPTSRLGVPVAMPGPSIAIDDSGIRYNGQPIAAAAELAGLRAAELEMARTRGVDEERLGFVYVQAHAGAQAGNLAEVVAALPDDELRLVVRPHDPPPDPLASAPARVTRLIEDIRRGGDASETASRLADAMADAIGEQCAAIESMFGKVAMVPADGKVDVLVSGTADSLKACDCRLVDLEVFEYLLIALMAAGPGDRYVPVRNTGEGLPIAVSGEQTVADLIAAAERQGATGSQAIVLTLE